MKKFIIIFIFIGIIFGGYIVFTNINKKPIQRCEYGFRFNPQTGECQPAEEEKDDFDFTQVSIQIPGENISVSLEKNETTRQYSNTFFVNTVSGTEGFVSLKESEMITYNESLIVVPFLVNTGGTGQFVYIGLFDIKQRAHLSSAFVGDRIGIDSINVSNEKILASFKTRLATEGYASTPTIPTQLVLDVKDNSLIEIMRIENGIFRDIEIKNTLPLVISNNTKLQGAIPGFWYFEAVAQYRLLDDSYQVIGFGYFQALSDWMTTQRVPFELELNSASFGYTGSGTLIIESENIPGDDEGERSIKRLYLPVIIQ